MSLSDWPEDDFRIFCGDLGNDVNDELLTRTFNKFSSFQRAKVIRDKRTSKSKGYGFVSFKDPQDFIRAMKEMDGKLSQTPFDSSLADNACLHNECARVIPPRCLYDR